MYLHLKKKLLFIFWVPKSIYSLSVVLSPDCNSKKQKYLYNKNLYIKSENQIWKLTDENKIPKRVVRKVKSFLLIVSNFRLAGLFCFNNLEKKEKFFKTTDFISTPEALTWAPF